MGETYQVVVKETTMSEKLVEDIVTTCINELEQAHNLKAATRKLKKKLDAKYGTYWHIVIGRNLTRSPMFRKEVNVSLKPNNMPNAMVQFIKALIIKAYDAGLEEYEAAKAIKSSLDDEYGPHWHVSFGERFGSYYSYETPYNLNAIIGKYSVVVYKAGSTPDEGI